MLGHALDLDNAASLPELVQILRHAAAEFFSGCFIKDSEKSDWRRAAAILFEASDKIEHLSAE